MMFEAEDKGLVFKTKPARLKAFGQAYLFFRSQSYGKDK
jgi:hypothetical protein